MIFSIAPLNPIRMVPVLDYDPEKYITRHFDDALQIEQTKEYQKEKKYSHKFATKDRPVIQILSDYEPLLFELIDCETGLVVLTPTVNQITADILAQTFLCYEVAFDFDLPTVGEGCYYVRCTYQNELDEDVIWVSEPINVRDVQEGTLLFEYTNSDNEFSMIFDGQPDPFVGKFRVEADLIDFKASSVDSIYNDEIHNTTVINSRPFRQFSLAIGGSSPNKSYGGVPDWVIDKVNRILSCNQVMIDGKYFCKSEGAQWEEQREQNDQFSAQKILVTESKNNFQLDLSKLDLTEVMVPIQKILQYFDNTENIVISNTFKRFTNLEKIVFVNNTGDPFTMTVETESTGGDDDFTVSQYFDTLTGVFTLERFFATDKVINISGIDSSDLNLFVVYKKLNAPTTGTSNPYTQLGVGAIVNYHEQNDGDFENDFDVLTGLGQDETAWAGWAICNGNNGTPNLIERFVLGNDGITNQGLKPVGQTGGSFLKRILLTHLPFLSFFTSYQTGSAEAYTALDGDGPIAAQGGPAGGWDQYRLGKGSGIPNAGKTNTIGGPNGDGTGTRTDNFDITPPFMRMIFVKKIADV